MLTSEFEQEILNNGSYNSIVGIDEVGRGCWAGPVAIGVYKFSNNTSTFENINDSKKLSLNKRIDLHQNLIKDSKVFYASSSEIDKLGISNAIEMLISQAVKELNDNKTLFLIDGQFKTDFGINTKKVIKGDSTYYSIAAASIVAKVERDNLMNELAKKYDKWGFEKHKGYGTKYHREMMTQHGICEIHRKSYKPVRMFL